MRKLLMILSLIGSLYAKDCISVDLLNPNMIKLNYVDAGIEYSQIVSLNKTRSVKFTRYEVGYNKEVVKIESDKFNCLITNKEDQQLFKEWFGMYQ